MWIGTLIKGFSLNDGNSGTESQKNEFIGMVALSQGLCGE